MLIETDAAVDAATLHRISQTDAVRSVRSVPAV
jgi:hypothetical protein